MTALDPLLAPEFAASALLVIVPRPAGEVVSGLLPGGGC